ncbi:MAG TPA: helix-turn-helix domain-containing protein, partial [Candidatus Cybelea sp.]|nr:helix-turn-helix domain-containing protein [Candidatus Cybelea sp.]
GVSVGRVSIAEKAGVRAFWRREIQRRFPQQKSPRRCRHCGALLDYDRKVIERMRYDEGLSIRTIARYLKADRRAIYRVLAEIRTSNADGK